MKNRFNISGGAFLLIAILVVVMVGVVGYASDKSKVEWVESVDHGTELVAEVYFDLNYLAEETQEVVPFFVPEAIGEVQSYHADVFRPPSYRPV